MGDKPEQFRETSIQLAKMGFKGIDLNMGCPVANVAKKGKGSGLILRPDVAAEIIQATKAGGLPVSVKACLATMKSMNGTLVEARLRTRYCQFIYSSSYT